MAAFAFEIEHGVDHVFHHARACDLAVFGDMAHQDHGNPPAFGKGDQFMRRRPHLGNRTRCRIDRIQPHGLHRIDDGKPRAFVIQGGQNIAQVGFRAQTDGRIGQAQPLGAHLHLGGGLFARNIHAFDAVARKGCRRLQQQCRFANPRIAAHQNGGSRHQSTAQNAVQFINAR